MRIKCVLFVGLLLIVNVYARADDLPKPGISTEDVLGTYVFSDEEIKLEGDGGIGRIDFAGKAEVSMSFVQLWDLYQQLYEHFDTLPYPGMSALELTQKSKQEDSRDIPYDYPGEFRKTFRKKQSSDKQVEEIQESIKKLKEELENIRREAE